jgi:large repetitive protein
VHEGQDFRYTLTVTNAGPSIARAATVTDAPPAGVALRSTSSTRGSCGQGDPVVCALGDLAVGGTATITLDVTATETGTPDNTAVVESPTPDPNLVNNSDHTKITTDRLADVAIAKSASTSVVADGEAFDWTLKATNHGPSNALGTVVTDTVPNGLRIAAASSTRGTCAVAGQTVSCDLSDLRSGASATVTITVLTTKAGSYTNSASVTSQTPESDPSNNVDGAAVEVSARADVAIAKTASAPIALVGETVTYGLTVTNDGPDDAADVTVTDPLPAGGTFVSAKPSAGTCQMVAGSLACNLGSVAPGAAVTIQLQVRLTEAGDTHNAAQVTSSTPDPNPRNNQAKTSETVEKADVVLTKTASKAKPGIGETATFTLTARNAGPALARGVTVTDPIPASLKYVSAKPSAGTCAFGQGAVVCNLGDVPNGKSVKITVKAVVLRVGDAGNAVSAVSRYPDDPNLANNLARTVVKAPPARLTLRKTASRTTVSIAGHVTYRLRVRNTGGSAAHHVLVCDDVPSGLVVSASSPRARLRSGDYCWTLSRLDPGEARTFTISLTPLSKASGRKVNHAVVNARDALPATASRAVRVERIRALGGGVTG